MVSLKNISFATLSILFLVIIHVHIKNFGGSIALPTAYLVWIGISFFVLIAAIHRVGVSSIAKPNLLPYILLFICLSLLSILFNPILNYHTFLYRTLGLLGGVIFFVALHQFQLLSGERDKLLFVIFIAGAIEAGVGLTQYFGPFLRLPLIAPSNGGSIYGSFQQPNVFSSFIASVMVISLFLISRPLFKTLLPGYKSGFYILVGSLSFVLFLSNSKAGLIGTIFGTTVLFISRIRIYKTISKYSLYWLFAVVIGMSASYASEIISFERTPGMITKLQKPDRSVNVRILFYRTSYEMFKDKPLFGQGPGNFGSQYLYYQKEVFKKNPGYVKNHTTRYIAHPHNETLYRLAESGLSGGVGLLILIFAFGSLIFRLGRERGGLYLSLLLPIGFHTQVEYPLYQSIAHWALFIFLGYLPSSYFCKYIPIKVNRTVKGFLLVLISLIIFITISFLIQTFNAHRDIIKYNNLLISKGEIRLGLLKSAVENGYLRQIATRFLMDGKLRIGLSENNKELIEEFVEWSQVERRVTPYSALYLREATALHALGLKKEAFKLLDEGLSLYPEKGDLLKTKKMLVLGEIKTKLSNKYIDKF